MLILSPAEVKIGAHVVEDAAALVIEREAARAWVEWSDAGPHAVAADVAEERVTVRISAAARGEALPGPRPGEAGTLTAVLSATGADAGRRTLTASVVVMGVTYRTDAKGQVQRVIEAVAVSSDGAADPVQFGPLGGEA